ncbi:hypothetical protein ABPG73_013280 [Tetrahymena malaccensis]
MGNKQQQNMIEDKTSNNTLEELLRTELKQDATLATNLSEDNFTDEEITKFSSTLAKYICHNQTIQLDQMINSEQEDRTIFNNLTKLTLNLSDNYIGVQGISDLAKAIQSLDKIQTLSLNLRENRIRDNGSISLASSISKCKNLLILKLFLKDNQIFGSQFKRIKGKINKSRRLIKQYISS